MVLTVSFIDDADRLRQARRARRSPAYNPRPTFPAGPLTAVDQARIRLAYFRFEHETVAARAAAGVPEAVEALPRHTAELERLAAELHTLEGTVSTIENRDKAVNTWRIGVRAAQARLAALMTDAPKYPADHVKAERARILAELRTADALGSSAVQAYLREASTAAALLRAKAEAEADPARAMADELAAARLARGNGEDLVRHAHRLIEAGQPAAARPYVLAVESMDVKPKAAGQLQAEYQAAMAEADPTLRQAAAVERTARDAAIAFDIERHGFLADAGLGLAASGEAGTGVPGQRSRAAIRAKLTAWEADPESYSEPAPEGPRVDGKPVPETA